MLWRNWSWPARILSVVFTTIAGLMLFPFFPQARESNWNSNPCASNLQQLWFSYAQYAQDYDDKLPLVDAQNGLTEAVFPYVKSTQLFQCPKEGSSGTFQPTQSGYSDYFFNSNLNRLDLSKLESELATIVLVGEGNDGIDIADARYSRRRFKAAWIDDTNSPMHRHKGTSNVLFLDGHVKSYQPARAVELKFVPELRSPRP